MLQLHCYLDIYPRETYLHSWGCPGLGSGKYAWLRCKDYYYPPFSFLSLSEQTGRSRSCQQFQHNMGMGNMRRYSHLKNVLKKNQGFYINLVVGAAFAPGYVFLLPHTHTESVKTLQQKLRMIDWIGIIFFTDGCTDLIVVITFVGSIYSWGTSSR